MFQRIQAAYAKLTRELSGEYICESNSEEDEYYDDDDYDDENDEDCDHDCECFFHGGIPPWEFFEQLCATTFLSPTSTPFPSPLISALASSLSILSCSCYALYLSLAFHVFPPYSPELQVLYLLSLLLFNCRLRVSLQPALETTFELGKAAHLRGTCTSEEGIKEGGCFSGLRGKG